MACNSSPGEATRDSIWRELLPGLKAGAPSIFRHGLLTRRTVALCGERCARRSHRDRELFRNRRKSYPLIPRSAGTFRPREREDFRILEQTWESVCPQESQARSRHA